VFSSIIVLGELYYTRLSPPFPGRCLLQKLGNKLGTISAEHHQKPTRMVQDELRRINTIDNPRYLDTVEVIGSIPVAPIDVSVLSSASPLSFFCWVRIGCGLLLPAPSEACWKLCLEW
jgi:hypothetical protein